MNATEDKVISVFQRKGDKMKTIFKQMVFDGYKWEALPRERKYWYVMGFSEGIFEACQESYHSLIVSVQTEELVLRRSLFRKQPVPEACERAMKLVDEFVEKTDLGNGTIGNIVTRLNEFYRRSENKEIDVSEAIYIVKLEIEGAPNEFIKKQTKILRIPIKDRQDKHYALLKRNQKYNKAFKKWGKYIPNSISGAFF